MYFICDQWDEVINHAKMKFVGTLVNFTWWVHEVSRALENGDKRD